MSRLADIYKSEKSSGGGLGSTLGKAALEKIDPRKMFNQQGLMAAMLPSLFKAYKATPKSNTMSSRLTAPSLNTGALESQMDDIAVNTRLTAKNTMVLPMMARDSNLTKLNIMKLVKLQGGQASKKSDMFWKDSATREKEYESKFSKEKSKSAPSSGAGAAASTGKAGGLKGIGLDFLSSLAGGIGKGVGIAAIGLGIGGFFAGLAAGGAAVTALGGAKGVKDMLVNLAEGLGAFSGTSFLALSALLGTGMLFGAYAGAGKSLKGAVGMTAVGVGIGGFLVGLGAGAAIIELFGGGAAIKEVLVNLAEGLGAFSETSLIALGGLFAAGAVFGMTGQSGNAAIGIGAMGVGIGGFLAALGLAAGFLDLFGGGPKLKDLLLNVAEGLGAFSETSLIALGGLFAAGSLFGATGLAGSAATGIGLMGVGIGAFLTSLGLAAVVIDFIGGGPKLKNLLINIAEGLGAFSELDGMHLGKLALAIPLFGSALFSFFSLTGIAGMVKEFTDGMAGLMNFIFGNEKSGKTPMQQLAGDLKLFENINGDNLSKVGQGFKDLASGLLGFAKVTPEDLEKAVTAAGVAARLNKVIGGNQTTAPAKTGGNMTPEQIAALEADPYAEKKSSSPTKKGGMSSSRLFNQTEPSITPTKDSQSGDEPSEELISNIKKLEGFSAKAFWDHKQYSNGYGTKALSENEVIDEKEADRRLRAVVKETRDKVIKYGKKYNYGFNSSQIDSLTSFAYNLGPGILDKVTDGGKRSIKEIAEAIPKYNKASGEVNKGLEKRRNIELAMFNSNPSSGPTTTLASASSPSSGAVVASSSTSVADQRLALMSSPNGTTNINAPTTNNTVAAGGGSNSGGVKLYNEALRVDSLRMVI